MHVSSCENRWISEIKILIQKILQDGITLYEGPPGNLSEIAKLHYIYLNKIQHENIDPIKGILASSKEMETFIGKSISNGCGSGGVNAEQVANWLVIHSHLTSVDESLNILEEYLKSDHNEVTQNLAFGGLQVEAEIEFSENLKLIPFDGLPISSPKEMFFPLAFRPDVLKRFGIPPLDPFEGNYRAPTAAFVRELKISPKVWKPGSVAISKTEINEALDFLTLIPGCSPSYAGEWNDFKDSVPCKYLMGSGSTSFLVGMGHSFFRLTPEIWAQHKDLYHCYRSLKQNERDGLRVSLSRLNQSRNKPKPVDKALDLGIAYEAFFLNDSGDKEQISYKLRLRVSKFLGDNLDERKSLMNFISEFYGCRSSAAHSGHIKEVVKLKNIGKVKTVDILREADNYLVMAIKKAILSGELPNWESLVLDN